MTSNVEPTQQQNLQAEPAPQEAPSWKQKGKDHLASAQPKEAVACFDKAIKLNPNDLEAYLSKAIALGRISGKLQASLACFDKVIQSKDPALLDECYTGLVKVLKPVPLEYYPETVLAFYDRLLQAKPDDIQCYLWKIQDLVSLERFEEALTCFEKMLDIDSVKTPADRSKAIYEAVINGRYQAPDMNSKPDLKFIPIRDINYSAGALFLKRVIQLDPSNDEAYYVRADSLQCAITSKHNFSISEEAIKCLEQCVQVNKTNIGNLELFICFFCDIGLACDCFTQVITQTDRLLLAPYIKPEEDLMDYLYNYKGLALSALGRYQEAIACFDKGNEVTKGSALALGYKAEALTALGQLEDAIKCIDEALKIDTSYENTFIVQHSKGIVLAAAGRTEEAIECFKEAFNMSNHTYPGIVPKLYFLRKDGDVLDRLGQQEMAANSYAAAGRDLANMELYDIAFELYDKAIKSDPVGGHDKTKTDILLQLEKFEAALTVQEKAIQANPKDAGPYAYKAKLLYLLGKSEVAVQLFDEAKQRCSSEERHVALWCANDKGVVLYTAGQYEAAIASYDESLKLQSETEDTGSRYEVLMNKGLALCALRQYEKAISCFDEAKPYFEPFYGQESNIYQHFLHKGRALAELGKFEEALKNFDEALSITQTKYDERSFVLFYKGRALSQMSEEKEALGMFEEAYEIAYGSRNREPWKDWKSFNILAIEKNKQRAFTFKEREALLKPLTGMQQAVVEVEEILVSRDTELILKFKKLKEEKNDLIVKCAKKIDDYYRNISSNNDELIKEMVHMKEQIDLLQKDICKPILKNEEPAQKKAGESKSKVEPPKKGKGATVGKKTTEKSSLCNMW